MQIRVEDHPPNLSVPGGTRTASHLLVFVDMKSVMRKYPTLFRQPSVATYTEDTLAQFAFSGDHLIQMIVRGQLRVPHAFEARFRVPRTAITAIPGLPGDIDILLCDPARPSEAVAIECKVLKVKPEDFADDSTVLVRGLPELKRGVEQGNGLAALGFHRSYLLVLLAVDGSERVWENFIGRGLTPLQLGVIYRTVEALMPELSEAVGFARFEAVQITGREIHLSGGIGLLVSRQPATQVQPTELSNRVAAYLAHSRE